MKDLFDISNLDQIPIARSQRGPEYPYELKRQGVEGVVEVAFIATSDGRVTDVQVIKSSHPGLNSAAIQAVSKWLFRPGRKNGRNVNTKMSVPIEFKLTDE